ncbi:hypothetical protein BSCG_04403 [Bacteroides sp. 2_2_4]|nr:hypothetical protein BSCG_04403 [Bacteroides sp. 2_2_4]
MIYRYPLFRIGFMACRCCASFFMDPSVWKCDYDANGVVNIDKEEVSTASSRQKRCRGRTSAWSKSNLDNTSSGAYPEACLARGAGYCLTLE